MRNFKNILRIKPRLRFSKRIDQILCVEICKYNIFFCFFNRRKQPLLVNKEFTVVILLVIVLDIVETISSTFVSIMLYLVSAFDVTCRPHLRKKRWSTCTM